MRSRLTFENSFIFFNDKNELNSNPNNQKNTNTLNNISERRQCKVNGHQRHVFSTHLNHFVVARENARQYARHHNHQTAKHKRHHTARLQTQPHRSFRADHVAIAEQIRHSNGDGDVKTRHGRCKQKHHVNQHTHGSSFNDAKRTSRNRSYFKHPIVQYLSHHHWQTKFQIRFYASPRNTFSCPTKPKFSM